MCHLTFKTFHSRGAWAISGKPRVTAERPVLLSMPCTPEDSRGLGGKISELPRLNPRVSEFCRLATNIVQWRLKRKQNVTRWVVLFFGGSTCQGDTTLVNANFAWFKSHKNCSKSRLRRWLNDHHLTFKTLQWSHLSYSIVVKTHLYLLQFNPIK